MHLPIYFPGNKKKECALFSYNRFKDSLVAQSISTTYLLFTMLQQNQNKKICSFAVSANIAFMAKEQIKKNKAIVWTTKKYSRRKWIPLFQWRCLGKCIIFGLAAHVVCESIFRTSRHAMHKMQLRWRKYGWLLRLTLFVRSLLPCKFLLIYKVKRADKSQLPFCPLLKFYS